MSGTSIYSQIKSYVEDIVPSSNIYVAKLSKNHYRSYRGMSHSLNFQREHGAMFPEVPPACEPSLFTLVRDGLVETGSYHEERKININETMQRVVFGAFEKVAYNASYSMKKRTKLKESEFLDWLRKLVCNYRYYSPYSEEASRTVESILKLHVWFESNGENPKRFEILVNTLKLMKLKGMK